MILLHLEESMLNVGMSRGTFCLDFVCKKNLWLALCILYHFAENVWFCRHEKTNNVVSDQVWHKPGCAATDLMAKDWNFVLRKNRGITSTIQVAKTRRRWSASRSYRQADLRLCFRICRVDSFLMTRLVYFIMVVKGFRCFYYLTQHYMGLSTGGVHF